jgi:hypothetical protein
MRALDVNAEEAMRRKRQTVISDCVYERVLDEERNEVIYRLNKEKIKEHVYELLDDLGPIGAIYKNDAALVIENSTEATEIYSGLEKTLVGLGKIFRKRDMDILTERIKKGLEEYATETTAADA